MKQEAGKESTPPLEEEIDQLRRQAESLGGAGGFDDASCPPETRLNFWKEVVALESAPRASLFRQLEGRSLALPRPEEVPATGMKKLVGQVTQALAGLRVFLSGTEALTDRQVYSDLWHHLLRDEYEPLPPRQGEWRIEHVPEGGARGGRQYVKYFLKPVAGPPGSPGYYHVTFKL